MAPQSEQQQGPQRLLGRKAGYIRRLWRRRTKRITIAKTPVEKARIAKQQREKKAAYEAAYLQAEAVIMEEATKLSEKFGKHTPQQCYRKLMQRARITQKKRSVNAWNVYLREEVKRRNDGKCPVFFLATIC
jgi:hypothetical protein